MKYNEPIRPSGIGKKQVAFPTGSQVNQLTNLEIDFENQLADSTNGMIDGKMANAIGIARSSAISAASEAHKRAQNYPFGMYDIQSFTLSGTNLVTTKTEIPFRFVNVQNDNFQYDARDKTIYVNESGWYWVQVFFYSTAVSGANDYALSLQTNVGSAVEIEIYEEFIDVNNTNKHPALNGTTIINLPNQKESLNKAGRYGFKVNIHGTMGFASFTSGNTQCSLHVFKLANLFEAERKFTTIA
jgi:hypothetical protein